MANSGQISRIVIALLLLTLGVFGGVLGINLLSAKQQFMAAENEFRLDAEIIRPTDDWIDAEPGTMLALAQDLLGLDELVEIREAYTALRDAHKPPTADYFHPANESQSYQRETVRFQLAQLIQQTDDVTVRVHAGTLLGDLYAIEAMEAVHRRDAEKLQKSYESALETYQAAIEEDPTETLNLDAKEHREILIRMFLEEGEPEEQPGPSIGPRGGSSDPGAGY